MIGKSWDRVSCRGGFNNVDHRSAQISCFKCGLLQCFIASKVRVEKNDNWNEEKVIFKLQIYKMRGRGKIFKILTLGSPNLVFCKTKEWRRL